MTRSTVTTLAAVSLAIAATGCGGTHSATPPPQKPGWTTVEVAELQTSLEKASTPPLTKTQIPCVEQFITGKYTPTQFAVLTPDEQKALGTEAKSACNIS